MPGVLVYAQEGGARVGNFDRELGKEVADLSV